MSDEKKVKTDEPEKVKDKDETPPVTTLGEGDPTTPGSNPPGEPPPPPKH